MTKAALCARAQAVCPHLQHRARLHIGPCAQPLQPLCTHGPRTTGRIVDADMVKPARAPLPPPPGLPAPAPRSKKKRKGGGRIGVPSATPPAGRRAGAVSAPEGLTRKQQREQRRAAAEGSTSSAAPDRGRDSAAWGNEHGDGSGAGATARAGGTQPRSARLKFPPGHRPVELQVRRRAGRGRWGRQFALWACIVHLPPVWCMHVTCWSFACARAGKPACVRHAAHAVPCLGLPGCSGARTMMSWANATFIGALAATET